MAISTSDAKKLADDLQAKTNSMNTNPFTGQVVAPDIAKITNEDYAATLAQGKANNPGTNIASPIPGGSPTTNNSQLQNELKGIVDPYQKRQIYARYGLDENGQPIQKESVNTLTSNEAKNNVTGTQLTLEEQIAQNKKDTEAAKQARMTELDQQAAAEETRIRNQWAPKQEALNQSLKEEAASKNALEFKLGRAGTDYASEEKRKLAAIQEQQKTDLSNQIEGLVSSAKTAIQNQKYSEARQLQDEANTKFNQLIALKQEERQQQAQDLDSVYKNQQIQKMQQEVVQNNADTYAAGLLSFDPTTGEVTMPDEQTLMDFSEQSGIPLANLQNSARTKAYELSKMSGEDKQRELNITKTQQELIPEYAREYQYAQDNLDYKGTWQDFLQEKAQAIKTTTGSGAVSFSELVPLDQLKVRNLSVEIFGKKNGADVNNLNLIGGLFKQGMDANSIKNSLQYSNQSDKFTGSIKDAADSIGYNLTNDKRSALNDAIDRQLENNNTGKALDLLKKSALDSAPVDTQNIIRGKDRTVDFLNEIQSDLKDYQKNGGSTNIFTGTEEQIASKLGTVKDEKLRGIATKISTALQQYRRSMTGVAFSPSESAEYAKIFPSISKTQDFNNATINALKEVFSGDLDKFYSQQMGSETYNSLYKPTENLNNYLDVNDFSSRAPANLRKEFLDLSTQITDASPGDLFEEFKTQKGFSQVGGDTNKATVEKVSVIPDNTKGGQCGRFVNKLTGLGVGDSYQSKLAKMDETITKPEPGMVFTMPYKDTGHIGIILSVNSDGTATVKDSNYYTNSAPETIKTHKIPVSKMTGFKRVNLS